MSRVATVYFFPNRTLVLPDKDCHAFVQVLLLALELHLKKKERCVSDLTSGLGLSLGPSRKLQRPHSQFFALSDMTPYLN